ncbi:NADPH-dependent ferric siderophore reductase [Kitasatospora sp. SolWspMP-SS2h]|uniref:siderophore-interacting protein n=1 Tax=Kitasatospora sp. SolWspMP-SS2h TaxID=1305729 RepID=UPI000DBAA935|nr:siderophore-interacting protein [Kitasatospora sp. SolWspMP-SS2h]RAJ43522.1 NADPH-dependent ferric siderophore reductase [Kitasatospora sp. SolWspMP-SS2h]
MSDLPIRRLTVTGVHRPTPRTARVTFALPPGGFALAGPDQQVKLYFPRPGQDAPEFPVPAPGQDLMSWYHACHAVPEDRRPWMRSFTLRAHDAELHTVDVDFVLHGTAGAGGAPGAGGPAAAWAAQARPGQVLAMFGPSPEFARPFPLDGGLPLLFACDESALPALGTLVEALPAGARAHAWIEVAGPEEEQPLLGFGELTAHWVHRGDAPHGARLLAALRAAELPPAPGPAWLAGEATTVRALRRHLIEDRRLPRPTVHSTGYWRTRLTQDDAPTPEDLADAQETLRQLQGN